MCQDNMEVILLEGTAILVLYRNSVTQVTIVICQDNTKCVTQVTLEVLREELSQRENRRRSYLRDTKVKS